MIPDFCTGSTICKNGGECIDTGLGWFYCACSVGFEGVDCSVNRDDCSDNNCLNGAPCIDGINSYTCQVSINIPSMHNSFVMPS